MIGYRTYIVSALQILFGTLATTDWLSVINEPKVGLYAIGSGLAMAFLRSISKSPAGTL